MATPYIKNDGSSTSAGFTSLSNPVFVGDMEVISPPDPNCNSNPRNMVETSPPEQKQKNTEKEEIPILGLDATAARLKNQNKWTNPLFQKHDQPSNATATGPGGALRAGKKESKPKSRDSEKAPVQSSRVQKSHHDARPDQKGRKCHVCGSLDHIKPQCPVRQTQNKSRKQGYVYTSLMEENQKLQGEIDALKAQKVAKAEDLCAESACGGTPTEVPEEKKVDPPVPYDNQVPRLNGKTWEYSMPLEEFDHISGKCAEICWFLFEFAATFNFTIWFWIKFYTLYAASVSMMWLASVLSLKLFNWAEVYVEGDDGGYERDFVGRAFFRWFEGQVRMTHEEMIENFERRVEYYRKYLMKFYRFLTGGRRGLALAIHLSRPVAIFFTLFSFFAYFWSILPIFEICLTIALLAPIYAVGIIFWLWLNYKTLFKVKHVYKTKNTRIADFIDRRPISIATCDVEHPRVTGCVKHIATVDLDLRFLGTYHFCSLIKEEILPNMELMIQMSANTNMFFPDDSTALNFFKKQPSRIQTVNTNRVDDVKEHQTAQTTLLSFAVYKDFQRRARLSGVPY